MSNSFETALENASTIPKTYRNKTNAIYKLEAYEYGTYYSGKAAGWEEAIEFFTNAFDEYLEEQKGQP